MMDTLMNLPVIGYILQFLAYLFQVITSGHVGPIILGLATPIALGALCGVFNERSGVVNIGIEGMMLFGAYVAFMTALIIHQNFPTTPSSFFGVTPALIAGMIVAMAAGVLISLLHAWLSITIRADQIISGTIINIFAFGITGYLNLLISDQAPTSAGSFEALPLPGAITDLPIVGWLFESFIAVGPIALTMLISVIVLQVLLHRSRWGLRTKAVGEHPKAAETVGIDVIKLRYRNVILGGIFAGLAGAYLTIEFGNTFQGEMTNGRGFIALAALIFGRWTPIGAFGAALLFESSRGIERLVRFAPPEGQLGDILTNVPLWVYESLPYIITIIVLAGVVGRSIPPAADGKPYQREARAA
jgi:simple sugar transport system permease protein